MTKYNFRNFDFPDYIISALNAVAKGEANFMKEQVRTLIDTCFKYKDGYLEPLMLKMQITRTVVVQTDKGPELKQVTSTFELPIISVIPINSLAIQTTDISFSFEVTGQYVSNREKESERNIFQQNFGKKINLEGRIYRSSTLSRKESILVDIQISPLPLSKGLLYIIDKYTTDHAVVENVKEKENEFLGNV